MCTTLATILLLSLYTIMCTQNEIQECKVPIYIKVQAMVQAMVGVYAV